MDRKHLAVADSDRSATMLAMVFRIHRMKDSPRESFRWSPHTSGSAVVKPKDYEQLGEVEAPTVYAAWVNLRGTKRPLQTGDILEDTDNRLFIVKYIGFEPAQWWVPEPKPVSAPLPETAGGESPVGPEVSSPTH
jgi:hypothetical protein